MRAKHSGAAPHAPVQPVRQAQWGHGGDPPSAAPGGAARCGRCPSLVVARRSPSRVGMVVARRPRLRRARASSSASRAAGREATTAAMHARAHRRARRARAASASFARRYRQAADTATVVSVRTGRPARPRDGVVDVPVTVAHARVRHDPRRDAACRSHRGRRRRASRGRSDLTFPGLRDGEKLQRSTTAPRRAPTCSRATARRWPRARTRTSSLASASAIAGALGPIPDGARERAARAPACPPDAQVGIDRARARLRRPAPRARPAACCAPAAATSAPASPKPAPDVRTSIAPSVQTRRGRRAGRPPRRHRGHPAADRRDPRARRASRSRGLQPPGSTFKIVTLARGPGGEGRGPELELSGPDVRDARRRRAAERQRRVLRRHRSTNSFAALLQLRLRAARREGGRRQARRDGRELRLQPPHRHRRRGDEHDPGREGDRRRPRARLDGDRPGPRAGDRAADGLDRGDDRPARPPPAPVARGEPGRSALRPRHAPVDREPGRAR